MSNQGCLDAKALGELSEKLKGIIWIIKASGTLIDKEQEEYILTGFSVASDGLILTSLSGFDGLSGVTFEVRKLNSKGFHKAKRVYDHPSWDLVLLQVKMEDCEVGNLAIDGSLVDGEIILSIGHPGALVGSLSVGRASYRCINEVNLPIPDDSETCSDFKPTTTKITPDYRVLGHVWNMSVFNGPEEEVNMFSKFKDLHPMIPIIQCSGLNFSPGCSGAPVFNTKGEIVGMLISEFDLVDVALHVSLLREFLRLAMSEKAISHKSRSTKGVSRKRKEKSYLDSKRA